MVKKKIKVNKKRVLKKTVLIYKQNKKNYIKSWNKRETIIQKTDCLFNALAVLLTDK